MPLRFCGADPWSNATYFWWADAPSARGSQPRFSDLAEISCGRFLVAALHGNDVLYRPVGQREYELIKKAGFRRFPPRLPEQPYFYPVTNEGYAAQIARDRNTKDEFSGFIGHMLRFKVASEFLSRYPLRTVGSSIHQEYWVPADDLHAFNDQIRGIIEPIACFRWVCLTVSNFRAADKRDTIRFQGESYLRLARYTSK